MEESVLISNREYTAFSASEHIPSEILQLKSE